MDGQYKDACGGWISHNSSADKKINEHVRTFKFKKNKLLQYPKKLIFNEGSYFIVPKIPLLLCVQIHFLYKAWKNLFPCPRQAAKVM